jgi:hypothetical protein
MPAIITIINTAVHPITGGQRNIRAVSEGFGEVGRFGEFEVRWLHGSALGRFMQ